MFYRPPLLEEPCAQTLSGMKNNHTQPGPTSAKSFHGMSLEDLFIIEICAGSVRLSKVAHQCGFRTMAVDHSTARSCGFPICVLI